MQALRLQCGSNGSVTGVNVVGGAGSNSIPNGVIGSTVFGGTTFNGNSVQADWGTVSGGLGCSVGADAEKASVAGGHNNIATGGGAVVSGGTGSFIVKCSAGPGGSTPANLIFGDGSSANGSMLNVKDAGIAMVAGSSVVDLTGALTISCGGFLHGQVCPVCCLEEPIGWFSNRLNSTGNRPANKTKHCL
jgi:hypothetical protein